jgi:Mn2+/Fe2+ NRAMP family transporter
MGAASQLLLPGVPVWVFLVFFGGVCIAGQVFLKHRRYVAVLKWLSLSLFSYFAVLCVVHVDWGAAARGLVPPRLGGNRDFWMMVVAVLGTTISPYLFFWQAAQEVEDTKALRLREPLRTHPGQAPNALARIQLDTVVGMAFSNLVALAIMITAAATLHAEGHYNRTSAADAAHALRPLAGDFAFELFAIGILGTGLLSVPVLAGSAAYALGEARRWPVGLARKPLQAKAFYGAIAAATVLGGVANIASLDPVTALVWAAIINAIVAVPVMSSLMSMATNPAIMGPFCVSRLWAALGGFATALMAAAALMFLATSIGNNK